MITQRLIEPEGATTPIPFEFAIASSHVVVSRVDLISSSGDVTTVFPVRGSVTIDARRAVRRSASLTFVDYDGTLVPRVASDPLSPYDGTMRIYRGVQHPNGVREYVPLGLFNITDVMVRVGESGVVIQVEAEDRARISLDKRWAQIRRPDPSQNIGEVLSVLVGTEGFYNGVTQNIAATSLTMPATYRILFGQSTEQSPWEDITILAQAAGFEVYFDVDGTFVAAPHPDLASGVNVVATYESGPTSTLLGAERRLTTEGLINRVTIKAEGSAVPKNPDNSLPQGFAEDTDLNSPTNTTLLGVRELEISSPIISSSSNAAAVARLLLPQYLGLPISFAVIPDPRLDVRDVVRVIDERIGVNTNVVIDTINIPLGPEGAMQVTGRAATL